MTTPHRKRVAYHVVPDHGWWGVVRAREGTIERFHTKSGAILQARLFAKTHRPSEVVVHRKDGVIEAQYTYDQSRVEEHTGRPANPES